MQRIKLLLFITAGLFLLIITARMQLPVNPVFGPEDSELSRMVYAAENSLNDKLICSVDTKGKKLAALTFDDGPDPLFTSAVLEILQRYHIKATFFIVGQSAEIHPWLVQREIAEGHEIANHTWSHPDLRSQTEVRTQAEIEKTGLLIEKYQGQKGGYFRPPRRLYRKETLAIAERNGYKTVLWTVCAENSKSKTPEEMAKRVINAARPGMIILAHDGRLDRRPTLDALPLIIEGLQEQGYTFVRLDTLIKSGR